MTYKKTLKTIQKEKDQLALFKRPLIFQAKTTDSKNNLLSVCRFAHFRPALNDIRQNKAKYFTITNLKTHQTILKGEPVCLTY